MPVLTDDQTLKSHQYPELFRKLLSSLLQIFQGKQHRLKDSGIEVVPTLIQQFIAYAYNREPFQTHLWTRETKPLKWWNGLARDSNSHLLAVSPYCYLAFSSSYNNLASCNQSIFHMPI